MWVCRLLCLKLVWESDLAKLLFPRTSSWMRGSTIHYSTGLRVIMITIKAAAAEDALSKVPMVSSHILLLNMFSETKIVFHTSVTKYYRQLLDFLSSTALNTSHVYPGQVLKLSFRIKPKLPVHKIISDGTYRKISDVFCSLQGLGWRYSERK